MLLTQLLLKGVLIFIFYENVPYFIMNKIKIRKLSFFLQNLRKPHCTLSDQLKTSLHTLQTLYIHSNLTAHSPPHCTLSKTTKPHCTLARITEPPTKLLLVLFHH